MAKTQFQQTLEKEYRRYHGKTGGIVGQNAITAYALAKARATFEHTETGLEINYIPEEESYESVYGEPAPEGTEFVCVIIRKPCASCGKPETVASLGFVESNDREYLRQVENELLCEALWGA